MHRLHQQRRLHQLLAVEAVAIGTTTTIRQQQLIDSLQQEELLQQQTTALVPLVDSIKELTECQRQLAFDQAEERRQDRDLDNLRQQKETEEKHSERIFRRKAELTDLARKYRKLNAELDPTDARSSRLSEFYKAETRDIDQEILQLDNRTVN
jgi:ABC-type transporter Mla subunit MlaD